MNIMRSMWESPTRGLGHGLLMLGVIVAGLTGCDRVKQEPEEPVQAAEPQPMPLEEAVAMLEMREPWAQWMPMDFPHHPAEKHLADWVIVLDPGHGGDADRPNYKRGPTGVREAEVDFRVAVLLKKLLEDAGAHVTLTRDGDYDLSLADRAAVANNIERPDGGKGADLFISLHHNAAGKPEVNYSSVWYHGQIDWSEPSLDVARYVAHALGRTLRTDVAYTSPLMSDQQIYDSGFGVLRNSQVPAILIESSFHSNPEEEQRIRDAGYNLREAYAIYTGLCEYAYGGRPTQSTPEVTVDGEKAQLTTTLSEGLPGWWGSDRNRIVLSTIAAEFDGQRLPVKYDPKSKQLTVDLPGTASELAKDEHLVSIHHVNMFKHHNWPQRYRLSLKQDDAGQWTASTESAGARRYTEPEEPKVATKDTAKKD